MLTNDRLIAVDQDGYAAKRIVSSGVNQVWSKREDSGDYVVALFNTGTTGSSTATVDWSQVGFTGSGQVTDLWSGADKGTVADTYSATLRPGEARLIRVAPLAPKTVRYQAEQAGTTSGSTVDTDHLGFTGTGFVNTANAVGAYVEWTVDSATARNASVAIRYANGSTVGRPMDVTVNGTVVSANRAFNGTGSWDTWAASTLTVPLKAGTNTIRVTATTANGAPNVDALDRS